MYIQCGFDTKPVSDSLVFSSPSVSLMGIWLQSHWMGPPRAYKSECWLVEWHDGAHSEPIPFPDNVLSCVLYTFASWRRESNLLNYVKPSPNQSWQAGGALEGAPWKASSIFWGWRLTSSQRISGQGISITLVQCSTQKEIVRWKALKKRVVRSFRDIKLLIQHSSDVTGSLSEECICRLAVAPPSAFKVTGK